MGGMACNIDKRGRIARLITGVIVDLCGTGLLLYGVFDHRTGLIVGGVIVSLAGAFIIFEGVRGWCVARALGFKTPM